jgi:hypothetical protein
MGGEIATKAPIGRLCVMHIPHCSHALCDTQLHHIHEFVIPSEYMRKESNFRSPGNIVISILRSPWRAADYIINKEI